MVNIAAPTVETTQKQLKEGVQDEAFGDGWGSRIYKQQFCLQAGFADFARSKINATATESRWYKLLALNFRSKQIKQNIA